MTELDLYAVPGYPGTFANPSDGKIFKKNWKGEMEEIQAYMIVPVKNEKNKTVMRYVHRLVALGTMGPVPFKGALVRHLDGNPSNNARSNLAWGTHLENLQDAIRHGRAAFQKGRRHVNSKLNEIQVKLIKDLMKDGIPKREIARQFKMSPKTMRDIDRGVTWSHVN